MEMDDNFIIQFRMLLVKLIHVSKRGTRWLKIAAKATVVQLS